ncbi:synaptobrevin homolog YKT6-like [Lepus europaeus]|uniref:synaptobrevin homolog YKT6-like n=1 Tax=Lepus europaeus TaxID=9983 RepID=UPI002B47500A|nr:synaptobrevin homolog YKT6-like [Lepus europaeus]
MVTATTPSSIVKEQSPDADIFFLLQDCGISRSGALYIIQHSGLKKDQRIILAAALLISCPEVTHQHLSPTHWSLNTVKKKKKNLGSSGGLVNSWAWGGREAGRRRWGAPEEAALLPASQPHGQAGDAGAWCHEGEAKVVLRKAAYDVSSFSFFQRASVQEFMTFTSELIVERSAKGSRASVKEQEHLCHVYVRNDSLAGVVIADGEYPSRVAFSLLEKVLDEFSKQVDRIERPVGSPATIQYTALDGHLSRYQNPLEADPTTKVQAELDETKTILHNTMESLLERGEKLDDPVSKSEVLGTQSKAFYKTARKQNSCCAIMGRSVHGPARPSPSSHQDRSPGEAPESETLTVYFWVNETINSEWLLWILKA